ncbi:glycosyltransferase family 1 protein, partial [Aquabacterium sp.]|uniref:glycosyltransferase family 4 protein n=1 Tax=Aquabacterium sp. TaxID=1872578 RepID=UPI00248A347D
IIQKIWIYTQALLHPNALVRKGLLPNRETAQNTIHARISAHDVYVMLGTAWERPSSLDFARKHRGSGGRVVQMIHDIVPVVRPEFHVPKVSDAFSRWLKSTSEITTLYLCVSKHTGADLRRYLNDLNREALIAITPLAHEFLGKSRGVDADLPETASLTSKALRPRRFALCVGSIEHRKNGAALIRAWSAAIEQQASEVEDIKLVFVGKRSWLTEAFERELAAANLKRSSIVVLESCTDDELSWLYCNAMLTVFPSLYEGWGLPVGESLWFHTPCLASSSSSIPEVGGDLVRYFCPDSIKDINRALTYALRNPSELEEQRTAIAQSNLRRWSDVARDVYSNLVDHINAPVPAYARSPKKSTPIKATR